jgi:fructose-1,6-bisphosphatase/inositol monophosphatase family enzyme
MNFNREIPLACVSIALWREGNLKSVWCTILRGTNCFRGVGKGAWLNGKPIRVSAISE